MTKPNDVKDALEEYKRTGNWAPVAKALWNAPPVCICCGGEDDRGAADPWEAYSVSCSMGPDWGHRSCLEKLYDLFRRPFVDETKQAGSACEVINEA